MLEEYQNSDVLNSTFETSLSKTFLLFQSRKDDSFYHSHEMNNEAASDEVCISMFN